MVLISSRHFPFIRSNPRPVSDTSSRTLLIFSRSSQWLLGRIQRILPPPALSPSLSLSRSQTKHQQRSVALAINHNMLTSPDYNQGSHQLTVTLGSGQMGAAHSLTGISDMLILIVKRELPSSDKYIRENKTPGKVKINSLSDAAR